MVVIFTQIRTYGYILQEGTGTGIVHIIPGAGLLAYQSEVVLGPLILEFVIKN